MDIQLIPLAAEHLEQVREWRNSEHVHKYMYTDNQISKEQQIAWFERVKDDKTKLYWVIQYEGKNIGVLNLANIDHHFKRCNWGFYFGDLSIRGKGIAGKVEYNMLRIVFEELKLNKVCCEVFTWNTQVIKMHEKFGFRREGYLREHVYKNGEFHDLVTMGVIKRDWLQLKDFLYNKVYGPRDYNLNQ